MSPKRDVPDTCLLFENACTVPWITPIDMMATCLHGGHGVDPWYCLSVEIDVQDRLGAKTVLQILADSLCRRANE